MAILRVAQMGHPILRQPASPVDPAMISTPAFQGFLQDMLETMDEYDGVGLAAPQVHVSLRVVALTLTPERGTEFMINPEITVLGETTQRTVEGCLSVDGLRGVVERPDHIRVVFLDHDGERRAYELRGFPAVVTQHECDHLDGSLYIDKADPNTLAFLREYNRYGRLDQAELLDDELDLLDEPGLEDEVIEETS